MKKNYIWSAVFTIAMALLIAGCPVETNGDDPEFDPSWTNVNFTVEPYLYLSSPEAELYLNFDIDITLNAANVNLTQNTTGASRGALSKQSEGLYLLELNGIQKSGLISISVSRAGYNIYGGPQDVLVYYNAPGDAWISFDDLAADGSAHSATTSKLTLTFSEDLDDLGLEDIFLLSNTVGAVKSALTRVSTGVYELTLNGINQTGYVNIGVIKSGYDIDTFVIKVFVYYYDPLGINISLLDISADGSLGMSTTSKLTLTFSTDIDGLNAADITLRPALSSIITKGALARISNGIYELAINDIIQTGYITVSVSKDGYNISGLPKHVIVWKKFEVEADMVISTFAGLAGVSGQTDGTGADARFNRPQALALDSDGNLYVGEAGRIRKITPTGQVTIFAESLGSMWGDIRGIAFDSAGNLFASNHHYHQIMKFDHAGIQVDTYGSGNLGFANGPKNTAEFSYPSGIAIDSNDTIYVADTYNFLIRKIDAVTGDVSSYAGSTMGHADGPAASAQFRETTDVAVTSDGKVIVADSWNHRFRVIDTNGTVSSFGGESIQWEVFRDGDINNAGIGVIRNLAIDSLGNILFTDSHIPAIRKLVPKPNSVTEGTVTTIAGYQGWSRPSSTPDDPDISLLPGQGYHDGNNIIARFNNPQGIAVAANGTIYVADTGNHVIRIITPAP